MLRAPDLLDVCDRSECNLIGHMQFRYERKTCDVFREILHKWKNRCKNPDDFVIEIVEKEKRSFLH